MADKQQTALKRLAKKLSALRATLSKDERVMLDRIVLGTADVSGHKLTDDAAERHEKSDDRSRSPISMTAGAATHSAPSKRRAEKATTEVAMHSMTTGAANIGAAMAAKKRDHRSRPASHDHGRCQHRRRQRQDATTEVALHSMTAGAANTAPQGPSCSATPPQPFSNSMPQRVGIVSLTRLCNPHLLLLLRFGWAGGIAERRRPPDLFSARCPAASRDFSVPSNQ